MDLILMNIRNIVLYPYWILSKGGLMLLNMSSIRYQTQLVNNR